MHTPETVLKAKELSKRYRLGARERQTTLVGRVRDTLLYPIDNFRRLVARKRFTEEEDESVLWALRDVTFSVKEGEVLGIIGHNGAGKSSLLKILSRITPPTSGSVMLNGRVSSLLEVGTGFHDDLTGRDNVFMNGTILGMTHKEVAAKFDEIVAFSGVERHIDTPIKFYSSGMKVRLAFAVAAHLDPEILIIDEVLAVGDLAFQQKCLGKMNEVAQSGRTVLFVSHNMVAVEGLCNRCILMEHGRIVFDGSVSEGIGRYRSANMTQAATTDLADRTDRDGEGGVRFTAIRVNEDRPVYTCKPLILDIDYVATQITDGLRIAVKFSRSYREIVMTLASEQQGRMLAAKPGRHTLRVELPNLTLMPGDYLIDLWAGSTGAQEDRIFNATKITILERDVFNSGKPPRPNKHGYFIPDRCEWVNSSQTEPNHQLL